MSNLAHDKDMITVTLPDGSKREYTTGTTGSDIAYSIGEGLGKAALAVKINDEMVDLNRPITSDANVAIITMKSDEALELIRHDAAHVMAQAVQELFPGTQVTIGPAVENGFYYDFARETPFTENDFAAIEKKMHEIIKRNEAFIREEWSRADAIDFFEKKGEAFKVELIKDLPESETISIYKQGAWLDLCRGPHMPTTGKIGKAFKLMKVAGAYWRGDSKRPMLQRIYATAWRDGKELQDHLTMLEEAEKRDHRKLGRELDLFHFQEEAPGQVFWHHNGWIVYKKLLEYMRCQLDKNDYTEVNTPQMLDSRFWKASGHWEKYHDNMFIVSDDRYENEVALKPMSCPGGAQVYLSNHHSYRDFPIRMAEFGKVFRREASGARHGLMRVQGFTQDDAHIFCTDEQLEDEVIKMCDLIKKTYSDLGMAEGMYVNFSTRPETRIGSDEDWDRAENALRKVLDRIGLKWSLNEGDGAFYAPKLDFMVRDAIGREWQCGTVQVDMNMPTRLGLSYIASDGSEQRPHMVHRAIFGSIERFMGIMIEHYAGAFPVWIAPTQVVIATITNEFDSYGQKVADQLRALGIRVRTDLRSEKITYKVREHSLQKIPYILAVGGKEQENNSVAVRRFGQEGQEVMSMSDFITLITEQAKMPQ